MSMFYDDDVDYYVATAAWQWVNDAFIEEDWAICVNNNVGDDDGVGIRLSGGDLNILGKVATAWGNPAKDGYENDYGFMNVPHSTVNEYGVGFRAQDITTQLRDGICTSGQYDFNMWGGSITITFKESNGCSNHQMYPGYVHTWDTTGVNS